MVRIAIVVAILWGCSVNFSSASVYDDDFFFQHLEVEDGLSQQTVLAIFQDAEGYMWFGTRNGLNRYDGYEFKKYRKDYDHSSSLDDNYIQTVIQDAHKNVWVATSRSINRIDYETERLSRYSFKVGLYNEYVNTLYCTSDGKLLGFTARANYLYDQQADSFRLLTLAGDEPPQNVLYALQDSRGYLYLSTRNQGVYVYDCDFNLVRRLCHDPKNKAVWPQGYMSYLLEEREDRIWMVWEGVRLYCYNPLENRIEALDQIKEVRKIIDWDDENLLVGTFQGLVLLNKKTLEPKDIDMQIGNIGGLSHYSVVSLYKDRHQNLWVGTYSGGVNYYNRHSYRFNSIGAHEFSGIMAIGTEDDQGTMWFATEGGGLLAYDTRLHTQRNYKINNELGKPYNQNIIKYILLEGRDIYCSMHGGKLYRFSISEKRFYLISDYGSGDICTLFRDSGGRLWIPTNTRHGLVVMDGHKQVDKLNLTIRYDLGVIVSILEIDKNVYLFGTRTNGVCIYNENTDTFTRLWGDDWGLGGETYIEVTSMLKDQEGNVWVATNGAGLFKFDGQMKLKKRFTKKDGLLDERVYGVIEHKGKIWVMASHEFYSLDKENDQLKRFYSIDGFMPAEFTINALCKGRDGKLYLSGTKSIMVVDPEVLTENDVVPPVVLTELKIDNVEISPNEVDSPLRVKLNLERRIVLKYNQTNLSLGYTVLNYLYPQENQYAYRMLGVEDKWNYVGNRREAFYSNLKPGSYTFQVIGANNDGVWNSEGAELKIVVLAPWWDRWWAWIIYMLIVAFVVCVIVRMRHKKHELERSLYLKQLEQEKLKELTEERTRFFTYVTHEFRTPLTLIINPLQDLLQKYVHVAGVKDALILVRRNAERLLSLVNSLMDIEKQQAGKVELKPVSFDFALFVRETEHAFCSIAESRNIHFGVQVSPGYIPTYCDKEKLEPVFFNLLSNAFKFTPERGHVWLNVNLIDAERAKEIVENRPLAEEGREWLYIRVKDDGVGISADKVDKIFDPFFQGEEDVHGQILGSGVGLGIARSVVEQQGGVIFVRPLAQGVEMCVLLPYFPASEEAIRESWVVKEQVDEDEQAIFSEDETPIPESDYKILLVEDHPEALAYLKKQLSSLYTVVTAINGREAWEMIQQELPDMLVSDVMMPEMDGIELCQKLKEDFRFSHIPVILLTAKSMQSQIEEGFEAGADDYIPKPFSISLLKVRIRNLFINREQMKKTFAKKFSLDDLGFEVDKANKKFMDRYVKIVRDNFRNPNLEAETIYNEMGMSRANFYKKLKSITDLSSTEMIRNIRLQSAAQLLKDTNLTVSEIAAQVGFSSNSYFGSCFKAVYGMSPKEYQSNG